MKHQPFETWLLSGERLSPEQEQEMNEHLRTCGHCRELREAWWSVEALFSEVSNPQPVPGFVARWEARLQVDRQSEIAMRYRWQSWISLILIVNAVSILAIVLGLQFFATFSSLTELLLIGIYRLTSFLAILNIAQNFLAVMIRILPGLLSPGGWAILASMLSGSALLWFAWMARLARTPRRTQL